MSEALVPAAVGVGGRHADRGVPGFVAAGR